MGSAASFNLSIESINWQLSKLHFSNINIFISPHLSQISLKNSFVKVFFHISPRNRNDAKLKSVIWPLF